MEISSHNRLPKLHAVGVREQHDRLPEDKVPLLTAQLSAAAALGDLADFVFFSPALLYVVVEPTHDPYFHFLDQYPHEVRPICCTFEKPVIDGLRKPHDHWHYELWALPAKHYLAYMDFMGTAAFSNTELEVLTRVRFQALEAPDPLVMSRLAVLPAKIPTVNFWALVMDTNHGMAYFRLAPENSLRPPLAVFTSDTHEDTRRWAEAWFAGSDNPYQPGDSNG